MRGQFGLRPPARQNGRLLHRISDRFPGSGRRSPADGLVPLTAPLSETGGRGSYLAVNGQVLPEVLPPLPLSQFAAQVGKRLQSGE